jgi:hypothetical protein
MKDIRQAYVKEEEKKKRSVHNMTLPGASTLHILSSSLLSQSQMSSENLLQTSTTHSHSIELKLRIYNSCPQPQPKPAQDFQWPTHRHKPSQTFDSSFDSF